MEKKSFKIRTAAGFFAVVFFFALFFADLFRIQVEHAEEYSTQ